MNKQGSSFWVFMVYQPYFLEWSLLKVSSWKLIPTPWSFWRLLSVELSFNNSGSNNAFLYQHSLHIKSLIFQPILKAHRQISKKTVFQKVLFMWPSMPIFSFIGYTLAELFRKPTIDGKFINKRVRLFIHQTMCREEKITFTSKRGCQIAV